MRAIDVVLFILRRRSSVAARRVPAQAREIAVEMAATAIAATLLAGCGQKGPLTLPKPPAAAPAPAASSPTR